MAQWTAGCYQFQTDTLNIQCIIVVAALI